MPAAKIGRLGVASEHQRSGEGERVLNWLKVSFTHQNKTGCRFLVVDAYNTDKVKDFYLKNGFQFLTTKDEKDKTRIMYFDLMAFVRSSTS
jgi:tRNA(Met) C34 N-acetyltransferase TmcA